MDKATLLEMVKLGRLSAGPQAVDGGNVPFVVVPEGCTVKAMPELIYNEHAARPERIKQQVNVYDAGSFMDYYNLFSDDNSRVFADETKISVAAVLDYHGAREGSPRWGQHRLTLLLQTSVEWKVWLGKNGKQMTQQEFAEFLEQYSLDIIRPDPAAMIEVSRELQATTEVEFGSAQRMQDGQVRFRYSETTKATCGAGQVAVPESFTISIPAFVGGARVPMDALLRFRNKEGKLTIWYTLVRPEEVQRKAFLDCRDEIASGLGISIINGAV